MKRILGVLMLVLCSMAMACEKQTPEQQLAKLKAEAAAGDADASANLGVMYDFGTGVPENKTEAVKWYRLAAAQGLADAQTNLGAMYSNG